jgi:hypothetical protein
MKTFFLKKTPHLNYVCYDHNFELINKVKAQKWEWAWKVFQNLFQICKNVKECKETNPNHSQMKNTKHFEIFIMQESEFFVTKV